MDQVPSTSQQIEPKISSSKAPILSIIIVILLLVIILGTLILFNIVTFSRSFPFLSFPSSSSKLKPTPASYNPKDEREQEIRNKINEILLEATPSNESASPEADTEPKT